jgi:putative transposase
MSKIARDPLYRRNRFPAEVIAQAVWLYFRFPLSPRMVEEMLAARGILVTHQTIRHWAEKFGRHYAGRLSDKWHMDEVVSIAGRKCWLWRAVDQDGFVIDVLAQGRRNANGRHSGSSTGRVVAIGRYRSDECGVQKIEEAKVPVRVCGG